MLAIFQRYNIPSRIQSHIYLFISMQDEFNKVIKAIDTGIHEKQLFYNIIQKHSDILQKAISLTLSSKNLFTQQGGSWIVRAFS